MGNKTPQRCFFNLRERQDLSHFVANINLLDGFYMDTRLSISSKCLVIINNLMNASDEGDVRLMSGLEVKHDTDLISHIDKLKYHCALIRHLAVVNSAMESVEELVELNNMQHLISLSLDHVPIRFVQHLKQHRDTLIKLSVHYCLGNLESIIGLCGGDHSFPSKWSSLLHLDVRCNRLREIDNSVSLLTSLSVLDISRNDIDDLAFIEKIPTLVCLNASFNYVRSLPHLINNTMRVLILAYNYLDGLEGIKGFKILSTLNVSFNMISTNDYLQQLKEMDFLKDVILRGNPIYFSENYRRIVLDVVSPRVTTSFAIDGKYLTKKENTYLRKRAIIFIPPALSTNSNLYHEVPVVRVPIADTAQSSSHGNRIMYRPMIENSSEHFKNTNVEENSATNEGNNFIRKEKIMHSVSLLDTDCGTLTFIDSQVLVPDVIPVVINDESSLRTPYYVGDKNCNLYVVFPERGWRSFVRVSLQIIEHKFMAVDELNFTVDNVDLWKLLAINNESLENEAYGSNSLKMVFYETCDDNVSGQLRLSTRTVAFMEESEMNVFVERLNIYLHGFSISYENWLELPLTSLTLICTKCTSTFQPSNEEDIRPFKCSGCSGTSFNLQNTIPQSILGPLLNDIPTQNLLNIKNKTPTNTSPGMKKHFSKSSTSCFVISAFGSTNSLSKKTEDSFISEGPCSQTTSYYTAMNESNREQSSYDNSDQMSNSSLKDSITSKNQEDEVDESMQFQLDRAVEGATLCLDKSIIPHECLEDCQTYASLKDELKISWVINDYSCDFSIHMHNGKKIDDRLKLYFLTKIMVDREELVAVYKVYFIYKSTTSAQAVLIVISNLRMIIFNISDKTSNNMEECLKLISEFNWKSLQHLEYCLHYQWLELQFKGKYTVTLFVGDNDSVKNIGFIITDVVTSLSINFSIKYSKKISELKSARFLSSITTELNDGATLESLAKSESYLIKSCTLLPKMEKSSLEYAPKMIIIEAEHIFFVSFSYSSKGSLPVLDLSQNILLYNVKNNIVVDLTDDCTLRLEISVNGDNKNVDIRFMSPRSRSAAAICIGKMLKDLFMVEILYSSENLS